MARSYQPQASETVKPICFKDSSNLTLAEHKPCKSIEIKVIKGTHQGSAPRGSS